MQDSLKQRLNDYILQMNRQETELQERFLLLAGYDLNTIDDGLIVLRHKFDGTRELFAEGDKILSFWWEEKGDLPNISMYLKFQSHLI